MARIQRTGSIQPTEAPQTGESPVLLAPSGLRCRDLDRLCPGSRVRDEGGSDAGKTSYDDQGGVPFHEVINKKAKEEE